ncbi:MAG: glycosyltransferase [Candidatus Thermoplasmatota archaeon]|nr:glycosyltransferase [Candidatus Thermoplasmatota archaeon]
MEPTSVVATVIPTWQESTHIERCIRSFMEQTYPSHLHQIIVLDGGSTDGTIDIVKQLAEESATEGGPQITLINNPFKFVPHARNMALEILDSDVEFILEMIGHAWVPADHLEIRVSRFHAIEKELGTQLGGLGSRVRESDLPLGKVGTWIESTLSCPLGGSGQFARFNKEGPTKIPPFTLYRRSAVESIGGWNEAFITTQDSEINLRLISSGWPLWRTPATFVRMAKRTTVKQWWRMGIRYGFWRMKHVLDAKSRMRIGEFLPWIGLATVIGFAIDGRSSFFVPNFLWPIIAYFSTLVCVGINEARREKETSLIWGVPSMLFLLHASFSIGLLMGVFRRGKPPNDRVV